MTSTANEPAAIYSVAVVLNRDLLFGSRIRSALAQIGLKALVVPNTARLVETIASHSAECAIAIIDMNGPVEWDAVRALMEQAPDVPRLAFGPHVDVEGRRAAKAAGISRVVSNGQFHRDMIPLIERYRR